MSARLPIEAKEETPRLLLAAKRSAVAVVTVEVVV
jgi:hypothetical protein